MFSALKIARTHPGIAAMALGSATASTWFAIVGHGYLHGSVTEPLRGPGSETRVESPEAIPGPSATDIARSVLGRNIFDSATGGLAWADPDTVPVQLEADTADSDDNDEGLVPEIVPQCTGEVQLLGALIFDREPQRTAAILRGGTASKIVPLKAEMNGTQLLALHPTHAYVKEPSGATCQLPLYKPTGSAPLSAQAPSPTPPKEKTRKATRPRLFTAEELDAGIVPLGGDHYKVSRGLLTRAMADAASVVRGTKFLPQTGGQRNGGVKIQGLREGSTLHKLGMRDGDVLRALNGVDLSSPDGMLGAYARAVGAPRTCSTRWIDVVRMSGGTGMPSTNPVPRGRLAR